MINNNIIMDNEIIKEKIESALQIICPLYNNGLISGANIVGSVAKGTARKDSDIDIIIVNPNFINAADFPPKPTILPFTPSEEEIKLELLASDVVNVLEKMGIQFKEITLKEFPLWYQLYKGEIFHLMTRNTDPLEGIKITKDLCD